MVENKVLVHGRRSSLSSGVVNNIDFVILMLAHGPCKLSAIKAATRAWRGIFPYQLFSAEYNYISNSAADVTSAIRAPFYAFGTNHTTYWYRVKRGVYALNINGVRRLARLLDS